MPVRPHSPWHREAHLTVPLLALVFLLLALVLLLPAAAAAQAPAPDRTVTTTPATAATWAGPVASGANQAFDGGTGGPCSKEPATYCDITLVNADPQSFYGTASGGVEFSTTGGPGAVDVDLYVYRSDASGAFVVQNGGARGVNSGRKGRIRKRAEGTEAIGALVGSSAGLTADERVAIPGASGWYRVIAVYYDMTAAGYDGRAEFFRRDLFPPDVDEPAGLEDSLASDPGLGYRSHSEPNIAQSPKDPNVLVAASKQYNRDPTSLDDYEFKIGTYVSFDRGRTWTDLGPTATCPLAEAPPASWPNSTCYPEDDPTVDEDVGENYITSDPWVDFDDEGNAYLMVLDSPVFEGGAGWGMTFHRWRTPSRGDVRRGRTWGERIPISKYETAEEQATILDDKNTFAVNNAGLDALAYQGIAIVAWVGTALAHVVYLRRKQASLDRMEFRPGRIPAFNPGGITAWVLATAFGVVLKITDTTESQFFDTWGLPLTFVIAFGLYTLATVAARPDWFAMARPHDPIDEVEDTWAVRVRCHRCDKSYVAHEMDRDPTGGHQAICAACATGPAVHAAARREAREAKLTSGNVSS